MIDAAIWSSNTPSTLILIDVQQGFDHPCWGARNNPDAETKIAKLLAKWRQQAWPVIHVRHSSQEQNSPLNADGDGFLFKSEALPVGNEVIFTKTVNSAFIGTDLEQYLRDNNYNNLVIAGLTTDHCVSTTTRMAGNLGFNTWLVDDACATFTKVDMHGNKVSAEALHQVHLASLHNEFCRVVTADTVLRHLYTD